MNEVFEIDEAGLDALIKALAADGFRVIGPTLGDGAVIYDEISGVADLPRGVIDHQDAGKYRIERTGSGRLFDHTVGPHSWKKYLFPPKLDLSRIRRDPERGFTCEEADPGPDKPYAFIGARGCDLAAIAIQDKVFTGGPYVDRAYERRRAQAFIVAVNCGRAGGTCFCASINTGPEARQGGDYDLVLTELDDASRPGFIIEAGSERGRAMIARLPAASAAPARVASASLRVEDARAHMGRALNTEGLPELLMNNLDSPRWDRVADRCLSCTNCTMVCPTCFCSTVEEVNDLRGDETVRSRVWDSCFSMEFSHLHGGGTRPVIRDRYRQWMTHKLSTWVGQFGMLGCIGCGRCITWCPPGIDITEEAARIRADAAAIAAGAPVPADFSGDARREKDFSQVGITPAEIAARPPEKR